MTPQRKRDERWWLDSHGPGRLAIDRPVWWYATDQGIEVYSDDHRHVRIPWRSISKALRIRKERKR